MTLWNRCVALIFSVFACGIASLSFGQEATLPIVNKSDFFVTQSCNSASANCHGSKVQATPIWSHAGNIWVDNDPHRNAYLSLLTDKSLAIVQKLWGNDQSVPQRIKDLENEDYLKYIGFLEKNCSSCHASEFAPISQREQGVDCQICHGSASVWGPDHYSPEWKALGDRRFQDPSAAGRLNVESPWIAAKVCGSCHIGELGRSGQIEFDDKTKFPIEQREVSHKLMAAGHPPTYFELSHFLLKYPKHWWDQDNVAASDATKAADKKLPSPAAARSLDTWRVGKLVNAKQRLELLRNRIGKEEWPEFTEHRCSSCHHPLDTGIQKSNGSDLAFAQWDAWYLEQVDLALAITKLPPAGSNNADGSAAIPQSYFDHETISNWNDHRTKLEGLLLNPLPAHHDAKMQEDLAKTCTTLIELLNKIIDREFPLVEAEDIPKIKAEWARRIENFQVPTSWEQAVQLKLAAQALIYHGGSDGPYPPLPLSDWDLPVEMWKRKQAMPYEASRDFEWEKFNQQLRELIESLK